MERTILDLVALFAIFGALGLYEQALRRYRRAAIAKTRPSVRETIENAEWEAVLRMRRPDLDAVIAAGQRFAASADRPAEKEFAGAAGVEAAAASAEE